MTDTTPTVLVGEGPALLALAGGVLLVAGVAVTVLPGRVAGRVSATARR